MAKHKVGRYTVQVMHQREKPDRKTEVLVLVFENGQLLEMAWFDCLMFNTGELRKRFESLSAFPPRVFDSVIEDARAWPKSPATTKGRARKPLAKRSSRRTRS